MSTPNNEDKGHFRLQMDQHNDDFDDHAIAAEVNELKLEKISQRVTLISILIPVLIAVVLVIAYLDIKKRVVQTEDTGTIEFRKLSSDLESRFSSLSVRQAKLEDTLKSFVQQNNQAAASVQVRLEKLNDAIRKVRRTTIGMKELNAAKAEMVKQINSVIDSANQAGDQIAAISKELKKQIDQLNAALAAVNLRTNAINQKMAELDRTKVDRSEFDVALKVESLKLDNAFKSRIQVLQGKIEALEHRLTHRGAKSAPASSRAPAKTPDAKKTTPVPSPKPSATIVPPSKPDTSATPKIEEQTISK